MINYDTLIWCSHTQKQTMQLLLELSAGTLTSVSNRMLNGNLQFSFYSLYSFIYSQNALIGMVVGQHYQEKQLTLACPVVPNGFIYRSLSFTSSVTSDAKRRASCYKDKQEGMLLFLWLLLNILTIHLFCISIKRQKTAVELF